MYKFVLIVCIAICAQLTPTLADVNLGYKYRQGYASAGGNYLLQASQPTSNNYFSVVPAFTSSVGGGYVGADGTDGFGYSAGSFGIGVGLTSHSSSSSSSYNTGLSGSFGGAGDFAGAPNMGNSYQSGYNTDNSVHYSPRVPIVSKHFWLYSAPEDHDEKQIVHYINVGQPRQNYHVVFINTPSANENKAKIIANVAPVEDKTVIYVLAKKSNILDVTAEVATPMPIVNKPEVFYIKYKTPEEAMHAQHTIQAQYDALGASNNLSKEGVIPVSSAIGILGDSGFDDAGDSHAVHNGSPIAVMADISKDSSSQNYLPPN